MKFLTDPVLRSAKQAKEFLNKTVEGGKTLVSSSWNKIPLFASTEAVTHDDDKLTDETHYFLVPFRPAPKDYALYTSRRLPRGYAAVNDLPKLRVFHLPCSGSEELLERLILDDVLRKKESTSESDADEVKPIHERLSALGEEVDKQTNRVTGGLLIVGGVVALANPIIGAGIVTKALLPAVGAKLSGEGLKFSGEKLKQWQKDGEQKKREKEAETELKSVEIKIAVNPVLQTLEEALATDASEFEPMLEAYDFAAFSIDGWQGHQMLKLTARAVGSVYADVVEDKSSHAEARLGPEDIRWLKTLREFEKKEA